MPSGMGFIVQAILGIMGFQSLLHVGALSVRLSEGFLEPGSLKSLKLCQEFRMANQVSKKLFCTHQT